MKKRNGCKRRNGSKHTDREQETEGDWGAARERESGSEGGETHLGGPKEELGGKVWKSLSP